MVAKSYEKDVVSNTFFRYVLIVAGTVFLGCGVVGIFVPILPTTPFLLLAAACYARGSRRCYTWLMTNRWFGGYIKNYREGRGIPLLFKVLTLLLLWVTILFSVYVVVDSVWIDILLLIVACGVTVHIVWIKTYKHEK